MTDLRARRLAAGLTQAQLAERTATARSNISAYESGAKVLSGQVRDRLIAAMRPKPSEALANRDADVVRIAQAHGATSVRLFGSVAKQADTIGSDLDLLVDLKPGTSFYDLVAMEDEIAALLGVEVDVVSARTATAEMIDGSVALPFAR